MSIEIDWEGLSTGAEGSELAESIRSFIDDKFQQVHLPGFIRSVRVHSFHFGKECPVVELKDISDPLPEFYEDEDSSEDDGGVAEDIEPPPEPSRHSRAGAMKDGATHDAFKRPALIDTRLHGHKPNVLASEHIATPLLPRSGTPGIPGGTSNLSYFHLPLSAGLSGSQTPLAAVAGGSPFSTWPDHHFPPPPLQSRSHSPQRNVELSADPSSRPSTSDSYRHALPSADSAGRTEPPTQNTARSEPSPLDTQITLHITYTGSVSLTLTASLLLDYPMSSFASIPLKLSITGLSFDGVALLAYLRKRAHFCFLGREDAEVLVGADGTGNIIGSSGDGGSARKENATGGRRGVVNKGNIDNNKLGGLIREIRVESEIGKREGAKQSLKNVGKVEKFVVEQVRRIFEEEFVWPSWWTFLV
ncbi:MAG: hypothetical protein Q9191_002909 [Dirinaria sp. TL-2023a]